MKPRPQQGLSLLGRQIWVVQQNPYDPPDLGQAGDRCEVAVVEFRVVNRWVAAR